MIVFRGGTDGKFKGKKLFDIEGFYAGGDWLPPGSGSGFKGEEKAWYYGKQLKG
jgi:hypothetical protein